MNTEQPSKVTIEKNKHGFQFIVNAQPFYAKGAGVGDVTKLGSLAEAGANCFRTWSSVNAEQELECARKHNLMVALGFDLQKELHGFDYDDEQAVARQFEHFTQEVEKYKNHPNLLCWLIANEPNLLFDGEGKVAEVNAKVYDHMAKMIDYLHEHDPNHPVSYSFAGVDKQQIATAMAMTKHVDIVSVQVYGDLQELPKLLADAKVKHPVMITEYGPKGHWQTPFTRWGREIEEPSAVKAQGLKERLLGCMANDIQGQIIGDFVFYWGQKQERTTTWYGMFDKQGLADPRVDIMTEIWTGKLPDTLAPNVTDLEMNGQKAGQSLTLNVNERATAQVFFERQSDEKLTAQWALSREVDIRSDGGAFEQEGETLKIDIDVLASNHNSETIRFTVPKQPGEYRLYCSVINEHSKVGNVNLPFLVN